MTKKGKTGKKKQNKEDKKDALPEVEKEYYEIQIADLNKKLTRLRTLCAELENENEDCKKKYKILDQDRSDVIAYLKRSLTQKQDEIVDLTNRLEAIQKDKTNEANRSEGKLHEMERKYKDMSNSLTAEITLLNGKLNSLEEFKIQKDLMVRKYMDLEEKLKTEVERHLEQEAITENKSLIQKESLRMDIEKRLLNLSILLQKDTQYKIAETTQNIVRENIALNNELNLIIVSWQKLFDENETLKKKMKTLSNEIDVSFEIKDNLVTKHVMQKQIINCLLTKHEEMMGKFETLKNCELRNKILEKELNKNEKTMNKAVSNYKKIEKMYHDLKIELAEMKLGFDTLKNHNYKLEERIKEAVVIIKDVIGLGVKRQKDPFGISEQDEYSARNNLLNTLLKLFDDVSLFLSEEVGSPVESQDSILATDWKDGEVSEQLLLCPSEPSTEEDLILKT